MEGVGNYNSSAAQRPYRRLGVMDKTYVARLITQRSQVQILPPLP